MITVLVVGLAWFIASVLVGVVVGRIIRGGRRSSDR